VTNRKWLPGSRDIFLDARALARVVSKKLRQHGTREQTALRELQGMFHALKQAMIMPQTKEDMAYAQHELATTYNQFVTHCYLTAERLKRNHSPSLDA